MTNSPTYGERRPSQMRLFSLPEPAQGATLGSAARWAGMWVRYRAGALLDRLLRRDLAAQRERRVVSLFRGRGTAALIARHLAVRIDMLPLEVCAALAQVQDEGIAFPLEVAVDLVSQAAGAPIEQIFETFDPTPIHLDSLSNVYQARLRSGELVAVRVLRPGADLEATAEAAGIGLLCRLAEALTLYRSGHFENLMSGLQSMLRSELDTTSLTRHQQQFRKRARKARLKKRFGAAKIHLDYSDARVIVSAFISGIRASEVIAAVEEQDAAALSVLRDQQIELRTLGRRLIRMGWWQVLETPFFAVTPRAESIVIEDGRRLVFTHLGECESASAHVVACWREALHQMSRGDYSLTAIALTDAMDPFPYIDIELFTQRLETRLAAQYLSMLDRDSEWWERTSTGVWLALADTAREHGVLLRADLLRLMQASINLEMIALRLWGQLRPLKEFRRYERAARRRRAQRLLDRDSKRSEKTRRRTRRVLFWRSLTRARRARTQIDAATRRLPLSITRTNSLGAYLVSIALRLFGLAFTASAIALVALQVFAPGDEMSGAELLTHPWFLAALGLGAAELLRRTFFRLGQREEQ